MRSARGLLLCGCLLAVGLVIGAVWHREQWIPFPQLSEWKLRRAIESAPAGRWRAAPVTRDALDDQQEAIRKLQAIGYVSGTQTAPARDGVVRHDPALASPGLNLVVSGHAPEARLMTLDGEEIHVWRCDVRTAWPDFDIEDHVGRNTTQSHTFWRRAHVMENGDLLGIFEGIGLFRLDKDSRVIWSVQNGAHHDLYVGKDGRIYVLTRKAHIDAEHNPDEPILEDFITVLDADGGFLEEVSILEALRNSPYATLSERFASAGDLLHTNTIEIVERADWERPVPWKLGQALVSILELDLVCLIDLEEQTVIWAESDRWRRQHQPTILEDGNLLVLNNHASKDASSVLELDPVSDTLVWYYGPEAGDFFRTDTCGTAQRLSNGNTLITESDPGRAFEVTTEKSIVWEYVNPHRTGRQGELIATLLEVVRLEPEFAEGLLQALRSDLPDS